jgi:hypothetical protein
MSAKDDVCDVDFAQVGRNMSTQNQSSRITAETEKEKQQRRQKEQKKKNRHHSIDPSAKTRLIDPKTNR